MTREEIANTNLKKYDGLGRAIKVQDLYFDIDSYAEDTILTLDKAKSFAGQDTNQQFDPETSLDGDMVSVIFNCDGSVMAHKVDYNNPDEVDELSAVEGEDEYLVPAGTHFVVTSVSNEDDVDMMGYCEVDIEQLSDDDYQEMLEDGATESDEI